MEAAFYGEEEEHKGGNCNMSHHGRQHLIICFDKTEKIRKTLSYAFLRDNK